MNLLDGLRILDFSRLLPGPFGTQHLSELGADVLKLEATGGGDYARYFPPLGRRFGFMFHGTNRGKKSLAIDLKHPDAKGVVERLLGRYDVVVESFRAGVMDRLGMGYEHLRAMRPDLIYVSLSGYGADGPLRGRAGHDINFLARTGVAASIGTPNDGPILPGIQLADMSSGLFIALAVASAAYRRAANGEGARVDLSMAECTFSMAGVNAIEAHLAGREYGFGESSLGGAALCYHYYRAADDRFMAVGALEPEFWRKVCAALELPELLDEAFAPAREDDPRFQKIAAAFRARTQAEWIAVFDAVDACVEPVMTFGEAMADAAYRERGAVAPMRHPEDGAMPVVRSPIAHAAVTEAERGPEVGEHTRAALGEVGFSPEDIDALIAAGCVQAAGS